MAHRPVKYFRDMLEASRRVGLFVQGRTFADYQADLMMRCAVERELQVLGEAMYQLSRHHPDVAATIPRCRDIVNFRHVLVHGYDKVADDVVWGVAVHHVPELHKKLEELLADAG